MWFMYVLIGAYITIPFLSSFLKGKSSSRSLIIGFTVIWFTYFQVIPSFAGILENRLGFSFKPHFHLYFFGDYIGYLTLGCWLGHISLSKPRLYLAIALFIISWLFIGVGNYILEIEQVKGHPATALLNPARVVMAASLFFVIRSVSPVTLPKWIQIMSRQTLGVYLAHPLILIVLLEIPLTAKLFESDLFLLRATALLVLSCFLVIVVEKIPVVKRIVT